MTDVVDSETRSRMMAGIRSRDTKPEITVRKYLHRRGFRYRIASRNLPGRPDIVLARYRTAIFVHGCFWHRHPGCRYAATPATRKEFWQSKFDANVARDKRVREELEALNWRVIVVWECSISPASLDTLTKSIVDGVRDGTSE